MIMADKSVHGRKRETLTNFDRLFEKLSHDGSKPEVFYERLHQKLETVFRLKGLKQSDIAADESLDRLAAKLEDKHYKTEEIERLAFSIARYVYKEFYRGESKEEKAIDGFRQTLLNADPQGEIEKEKRWQIQLRVLERLPAEDRQLLLDYYKEGTSKFKDQWREQLAKSRNLSKNSLRVKVLRIRTKLEKILETEPEE